MRTILFDPSEHHKRLETYLQQHGFSDIVRKDPRVGQFIEEVSSLYDKYCEDLNAVETIMVHKMAAGDYAFLSPSEDYEVHKQRLATLRQLIGRVFPTKTIQIANSTYSVDLDADDIEGLLFLQMPKVVGFKDQFSLLDELPERIVQNSLVKMNGLTEALIKLLGRDDVLLYLAMNDPDDREELLKTLQARLTALCDKVNCAGASEATPPPLLDVTIHSNNGLQLTFRADHKKCFYSQLSEATRLLFAFYLYSEAYEIANAVLLFDEPNAGFHPSAQGFVLRFLQKLSVANQVIFSTHSQHMIDLDGLGGVRLMGSDSTQSLVVRNHFYRGTRRGDFLALQPIADAIGLNFASQIYIRNRIIITEGITDMFYLRSFRIILGVQAELSFAPARGDSTMSALVSFLISQGLEFKILCDAGGIASRLQERFALEDRFIWQVRPWKGEKSSGIEDLFSKQDFRAILEQCDHSPDEPVFEQVSNSQYMRRIFTMAKRVVAHKFYQEAGKRCPSDFTVETLENFRSALEFCANSDWCVV